MEAYIFLAIQFCCLPKKYSESLCFYMLLKSGHIMRMVNLIPLVCLDIFHWMTVMNTKGGNVFVIGQGQSHMCRIQLFWYAFGFQDSLNFINVLCLE